MASHFLAVVFLGGALSVEAADRSLEVLVYNFAEVTPAVLGRAEAEASRILATAGVEVTWLHCPGEAPSVRGCTGNPGPDALAVHILPATASTRQAESPQAMGFAVPPESGPFGQYAGVFYGRVEALGTKRVGKDVLLGHVIAHELGHLLLGGGAHTKAGIMRAEWNSMTLESAARGELVFDSREKRRIEGNVALRLRAAR